MIIERRIAFRNAFQPVIKIENDLVKRQLVNQHDAVGRDVLEFLLDAAFLIEQRQDAAEKFVISKYRGLDERLLDLYDTPGVRHFGRAVDLGDGTIGRGHAIPHAGRGRDQFEIEFTLKPLLDDLHVQQAEKSAAKAKSKSGRRF